jgi:undecaprenyl diphosphate synthase
MLWQLAYAEIIFEKTLWPDYNVNIFSNNILEFLNRKRRFGGLKNE